MPSSSSRSPVIRLHGYDILADVGVRPTAQVYKVRPKLHEDVPAYMDDEEPCYALKCIDLSEHSLPTEGKQRAVRETQALLKLQHTNIARYHKAFLSEGLLCVMSEFAEAGTLHHLIYTLKERGQQTEAMAQELSLSHAQVSEYKYEISRIGKELRETKKKFFEQKKREQAATTAKRAERAHLTEMLVHEARSTLNRFTGGGFNLNMTAG